MKHTFIEALEQILTVAKDKGSIKLREVFRLLAGKGYAALLILFSFPFCLPIQIPGFSTPFGIILALSGLRIAYAKNLWWPKWVLEKELSYESLRKVIEKFIHLFRNNRMIILRPRLKIFVENEWFHRLNGILVFFLGIILSLPLPIPFTNLLAAVPILCLGLGLLEEDGVFIILGYVLSLLCFSVFITLFFLGKAYLFHADT